MQNVTENVRYLVSTEPSISFAARRLGLNRQQLNKYLNGTSLPSLRILRRFSLVFNVPTDVLTGSPTQLRQHLAQFGGATGQDAERLVASQLSAIAENAKASLAPYCGRYFRYHIIPTSPRQILRSYLVIYQHGDLTYALQLERLVKGGAPWRQAEVRRITQIVTYVHDRIQFIDGGAPGEDLVPECSIIYPAYTVGVQYTSGMFMGSFGYGTRPIYQSTLLLQRLAGSRHLGRDLKACGLFDLDDPELKEEIRHRLNQEDGAPGLRVADR